MNLPKLPKRTPTVDLNAINQQIAAIAELKKQRDDSVQKARLYTNTSMDIDYMNEAKLASHAVECAQEVLIRLQDGSLKGR